MIIFLKSIPKHTYVSLIKSFYVLHFKIHITNLYFHKKIKKINNCATRGPQSSKELIQVRTREEKGGIISLTTGKRESKMLKPEFEKKY